MTAKVRGVSSRVTPLRTARVALQGAEDHESLPALSGAVLEASRWGWHCSALLVLTAQGGFVRGAAFPFQPLADAAGSAFPGGSRALLRTRSRLFAELTLCSEHSVRISLCIYTDRIQSDWERRLRLSGNRARSLPFKNS